MPRISINLLFFLFLLIARQEADAFNADCVQVAADGSVTVNWDKNNLTGALFQEYYVYHSTAPGGPFTRIDSVFIFNVTTYTHLTANANNNAAYYYIAFHPNDGSADLLSDTIQAIHLNVTKVGGYANLTWNPTHVPPLATNNPFYKIYREYPAGIFTLIDSIDSRTASFPFLYSDQISICADTVKYRIEVQDSSGCRSVSNVEGNYFTDSQAPTRPVIDSVSVDASGNAIISWFPVTEPDTRAYIILQNIGGVWLNVDTVYGMNSSVYYSSIPATTKSESFQVVAMDSCINRSAQSDFHSSIFLQGSFNLCQRSVLLSWSGYGYWGSTPSYEVWVSVNGAQEILAGTTTTTSYSDSGRTSGSTYCYRVRAVDNLITRSTTSNKICVTPNFPPAPLFSYLRKVTVLGTNSVKVTGYVDAAAAVVGYELLRATSPAGPFVSVASIPATGSPDLTFIDNGVNTDEQVYYYKLSTIDSCGLRVYASQVSKTILLTAIANADYTNFISWTDYSDWPAGVDYYNIYRRINGYVNPVPVGVVSSSGIFQLTDTVMDDFYSDGEFCYFAEAVEAQGNPYFFLDTSRSNEICVVQEPVIFIPNAFHPGGDLNETFGPFNGFVNTESYSFSVFNRWGENIFSTTSPHLFWDGSSHGIQSPEGVYIYEIKASHSDGSEIRKVGAVTLIR